MTRKVLWLIALVVLLFPSIAAADVPKVGDKVWAMWTPEEPWYQGKAAKACAIGMHGADCAVLNPRDFRTRALG
jgi:hypothetical protein